MRSKAALSIFTLVLFCLTAQLAAADQQLVTSEPMQGVPPARNSQVTMHNFRDYPMSKWAFQNIGAPLNTAVIPRQGNIAQLPGPSQSQLGAKLFTTAAGEQQPFDQIFEDNYGDGVAIIQGGKLLHERYFHSFNPHAQHIWFSMSKSLASSAFGLLVEQGKVKLDKSPADYIPELKGSGFERVTIQQLSGPCHRLGF